MRILIRLGWLTFIAWSKQTVVLAVASVQVTCGPAPRPPVHPAPAPLSPGRRPAQLQHSPHPPWNRDDAVTDIGHSAVFCRVTEYISALWKEVNQLIFLESKCSNKEIDWNLIDKGPMGNLRPGLVGAEEGRKPWQAAGCNLVTSPAILLPCTAAAAVALYITRYSREQQAAWSCVPGHHHWPGSQRQEKVQGHKNCVALINCWMILAILASVAGQVLSSPVSWLN